MMETTQKNRLNDIEIYLKRHKKYRIINFNGINYIIALKNRKKYQLKYNTYQGNSELLEEITNSMFIKYKNLIYIHIRYFVDGAKSSEIANEIGKNKKHINDYINKSKEKIISDLYFKEILSEIIEDYLQLNKEVQNG